MRDVRFCPTAWIKGGEFSCVFPLAKRTIPVAGHFFCPLRFCGLPDGFDSESAGMLRVCSLLLQEVRRG